MRKIYVIADLSGRMNEMGKNSVLEYLLRTTADLFAQKKYSDIEPCFFSWNTEIIQLEPPFFVKCRGKSNLSALSDMLKETKDSSRVMLLSDGNFDYQPILNTIKEKSLNVTGIVVGADASMASMNRLTNGNAVNSDCIVAAVEKITDYLGEEE